MAAEYFRGAARPTDAVARVTFGFYNDQLFRIVVDYDRLRTEGMTEADMVGAISETYGPPSRRVVPTRAVVQRAAPICSSPGGKTQSPQSPCSECRILRRSG